MRTKEEFEINGMNRLTESAGKYSEAVLIADDLGNHFDWIDLVILFGKVATREAVTGSDTDLIISGRFKHEEYVQRVIEISNFIRDRENRVVIIAGGGPGLKRRPDAIDITVVTPELLSKHPDFIVQYRASQEHGVILFSRI